MAEIIRMPRMSDTMTEGVIVAWHKKVGDPVKSGEVLAEVETDKATMELESYLNGVLLHIGVEEGASVPVEAVIAIIGKAGEDVKELLANNTSSNPKATLPDTLKDMPISPSISSAPQNNIISEPLDNDSTRIKASPLAKKMAEDKGINLSSINGSGEGGRIVKRDLESVTSAPTQQILSTPIGGYTDIAVSQMRKTIARRLSESKYSAPHFYLTIEVNMDNAMIARKQLIDATGEKSSFNDMIIKASSLALKKHPKVNSSWLGDKVRTYNYVNIGVAIAVDEGLVVPVIRNADLKGINTIATEVKGFAEKAKSKKLQPSDYEGNTFSISNLGMFGIEEFTAIINPPDACILAVGKIKETPVVKNGGIVVGNVMKLTLSCDHRVVDGAMGAQFLQTLKNYLENPFALLG